jgi:hypothetical protein
MRLSLRFATAIALQAVACGGSTSRSSSAPDATPSTANDASQSSNAGDAGAPDSPDSAGSFPSIADATTPSNDGVTGMADGGGKDAASGTFTPVVPAGDASADPSLLCADIHSFTGRCLTPSCSAAYDDACPGTLAPSLSTTYQEAWHACVASASCRDALAPETSCMVSHMNVATPTAAQQALADDFCHACAGVASTLDNGLWCTGYALAPGSTGRMLSTTLLELSDAMTAKVYAADCIARAVKAYPSDYWNCDSEFENCVVEQYPGAPSACRDQ